MIIVILIIVIIIIIIMIIIVIIITLIMIILVTRINHVEPWLRTNGVRANGAAAKVINFDRLGKKVRPGAFGKIKVG